MKILLALVAFALALPTTAQPRSFSDDRVRTLAEDAGASPADAASLAAAVAAALNAGSTGAPPTQEARLQADEPALNALFGYSVALAGDLALVGVPRARIDGRELAGAAYVFVRSGTTWTQEARLQSSNVQSIQFGISVALSGDRAFIGAFRANSVYAGAAYVFVRSGTTWTQEARLQASDPATNARFGFSVALSDDHALVGAPGARSGEQSFAGAAYVFVRSGTTWTLEARLQASDPAEGAQFGWSVSLSGDRALVGAPGSVSGGRFYAGAAYVFVRSGATWTQEARLQAGDPATNASFGYSVALSGDRALVGATGAPSGAGAAYVFVRPGATWFQEARIQAGDPVTDAYFGSSVVLSGDRALVGAPGATSGGQARAGAAYVFARSGSMWTQEARFQAGDPVEEAQFGLSAALSGEHALIGAPGTVISGVPQPGAAYVFTGVVPVSTEDGAPVGFALSAPAPNPAAGRSALTLTVNAPQAVRAVVVDALGRTVAVAFEGPVAREAEIAVDASRLAPGAYVVRVEGATFALSRRLTVVR